MAFNNKIVLSTGEVLIDLTQDDVKPEHVQNGIIFHDKTGEQKTGTNTKTVDASEVTAESAEVLSGKTFGKGDSVQTGSMPNKGGVKGVISRKDTPYTIQHGYHDGSGSVTIDSAEAAKLIPSNIKEGVTILGVVGEYGADDFSSQEKEVDPSFEDQTVSPDAGYSFLTSVKIKAIKVTRSNNTAGGVTVTIG